MTQASRAAIKRVSLGALVGLSSVVPVPAFAHGGGALMPHDIWLAWTFAPSAVIPIVAFGLLYGRGISGLIRRAMPVRARQRWRMALFALGYLSLVVALISPLDALGESLFTAHMAQHMLLMVVAAPLLVLAQPLGPLLLGMPKGARRILVRAYRKRPLVRAAWRWGSGLAAATAAQLIVLWTWHAPVLFRLALASDLVHAFMHASFLLSAMLFWWSIARSLARGGWRPPAAVGSLLITLKLSAFLGLLIALAPRPLYPGVYDRTEVWGLGVMEDQQMAASVMWLSGMPVYLAAGIIVCGLWLARMDVASEPGSAGVDLV